MVELAKSEGTTSTNLSSNKANESDKTEVEDQDSSSSDSDDQNQEKYGQELTTRDLLKLVQHEFLNQKLQIGTQLETCLL